ncbi:MAG TPA: phage tail sheath C-terminal domain-containing protein [Puia sp.]
MPVQPTYPGVYITEIPSGVRTITGVATSITAFIGRALSGPVDDPVLINSFADYERIFGGLWTLSTMSYAVRDFYLNGGSTAVIVRIFNDTNPDNLPDFSTVAKLELPAGLPGEFLVLNAVSPGSWGNALSASVNYKTQDPTKPPSSPLGGPTTTFNLILSLSGTKAEQFLNVTLDPNSINFLPRVLAQTSNLVKIPKDKSTGNWILPDNIPDATASDVIASGGSDGDDLTPDQYMGGEHGQDDKKGLYALERTDLFNLLCIPPATRPGNTDINVYSAAMGYCVSRRAVLIVDPPNEWGLNSQPANTAFEQLSSLNLNGENARNTALYFPRVLAADPLRKNQVDTFVPCGMIAGVMARTDTNRGVWKSPAGTDASLNGIQGLQAKLTDKENGQLNPVGINCLRTFPLTGSVVWGARTLRGADQLADEYKYLAVRRTALFIEESLYRGTQWVVFEPNDEPLWAQIRLNIGAFMHNLFRQGAFQGSTPKDAYLVKCDSETTTQNDINLGIVNILVGFAPLKPAEFVIIQIQQLAGKIDT